jgi:hypothetical protein
MLSTGRDPGEGGEAEERRKKETVDAGKGISWERWQQVSKTGCPSLKSQSEGFSDWVSGKIVPKPENQSVAGP